MNITNKDSVLIASHFTYRENENGGGPPNNIRDFLNSFTTNIVYIELPFPYSNDKRCYLTVYSSNNIKLQLKTFNLFGPDLFQYMLQTIIVAYFIIVARKTYKVAFCLDNLSTTILLPWRLLRIVEKIVYYSIDYTPKRFNSTLLNNIYIGIDKFSVLFADKSWVVSAPIRSIKEKYWKLFENPIEIVPIGIDINNIQVTPINKKDRFHLFFFGTLYEKQGLQLIIESLPLIIKKFPKIFLSVAGTGDYSDELKHHVKKLGLENKVKFLGFFKNINDVYKLMTKAGIGLATYTPTKDNFSYYADPTKIKMYLGCGLPVLTTKVPPINKLIKKEKAGEVVEYEVNSVVDAIEKMVKDKLTFNNYAKNALLLSKSYNISQILSKAISNL